MILHLHLNSAIVLSRLPLVTIYNISLGNVVRVSVWECIRPSR
jgi:hypothetical protein